MVTIMVHVVNPHTAYVATTGRVNRVKNVRVFNICKRNGISRVNGVLMESLCSSAGMFTVTLPVHAYQRIIGA